VKRSLPQLAPRAVCQFVFPRSGRPILIRYELDGGSFTMLTVAVRASPQW